MIYLTINIKYKVSYHFTNVSFHFTVTFNLNVYFNSRLLNKLIVLTKEPILIYHNKVIII